MKASPPSLLTSAERAAPRERVEHALKLVGRIHRGDPQAARQATQELAAWRQLCDDNALAVSTAQRIWEATGADDLRQRLPKPASAQVQRQGRRKAMGLLGAGAGMAVLAGGARWYRQSLLYQEVLRTGHGQTLARTLPDGSTLDFAARTQVDVAFFRERRVVRLHSGEVRFGVAREGRPFTVQTQWGQVQVLGTVFTVSVRDGRMRVAVAQGRVAVRAPDLSEGLPPETLQAGEAIESDAWGLGPRMAVDPDDVGAWKQGWLVFRDTRLAEAVARWNDYLRQPLRLAQDEALHGMRISGNYQLLRPQAFVDSLRSMRPLRVRSLPDGSVEIALQR